MLSFNPTQRIYLAEEPADMRKQFDGLWALAKEKLAEDTFGGALFVFTNKDKDRGVGGGEAPDSYPCCRDRRWGYTDRPGTFESAKEGYSVGGAAFLNFTPPYLKKLPRRTIVQMGRKMLVMRPQRYLT